MAKQEIVDLNHGPVNALAEHFEIGNLSSSMSARMPQFNNHFGSGFFALNWKSTMTFAFVMIWAAGCAESDNRGTKETAGTLAGAALGGLLGAQFGSGKGQLATTATGVLIGALIGSEIGSSMDDVDRLKANEAVNKAHDAPLGETISWNNPGSGSSGTVTPLRDGISESGQYCREFQQSITVGGETKQAFGIACRQPDNTWKVVQS